MVALAPAPTMTSGRIAALAVLLLSAPLVAQQATTLTLPRPADPLKASAIALPMFGLGHVYTGEYWRATGIAFAGLVSTGAAIYGNNLPPRCQLNPNCEGHALKPLGWTMAGVSYAYSVADAWISAHRVNRARGLERPQDKLGPDPFIAYAPGARAGVLELGLQFAVR